MPATAPADTYYRFSCTACHRPLTAKPEYAGRSVSCRFCGLTLIVPPPQTEEGPKDDSPADHPGESEKVEPAAPQPPAEAAKEPEQDPRVRLAARMKELPPVKSAYQPSGKISLAGVLSLLVGAVLGVPMFTLVRVVMTVVGVIAAFGFVNFIKPTNEGFAILLLLFVGVVVAGMSKLGKNRNRFAACLFTIA